MQHRTDYQNTSTNFVQSHTFYRILPNEVTREPSRGRPER